MSTSTILMLSGGGGLLVFALAGIISWSVLRKKGKALLHAIVREYQ